VFSACPSCVHDCLGLCGLRFRRLELRIPPGLRLSHELGMLRPLNPFYFRLTVKLGMDVITALSSWLFYLDDQRARLCKGILPYARNLPGHLYARFASRNPETVVLDFARDVETWPRSSNCGELITEFAVQGFKPLGQLDDCFADCVEDNHPIVDIFHFGGFDRRMVEILARGIERVVNLEVLCPGREHSADGNVATQKGSQSRLASLGVSI
jgi:hypothetical protein